MENARVIEKIKRSYELSRTRKCQDTGGEILEVERVPLFCTTAPRHYQQNARSKRLEYTCAMKQAIHFRQQRR